MISVEGLRARDGQTLYFRKKNVIMRIFMHKKISLHCLEQEYNQ
jgi:hypothetical protein